MSKIILKNSSVSGKKPTASELSLGELAVNVGDGSLFVKKSDGTIVSLLASAAPSFGNVVGDTVTTCRDLSATHLLCDGAKYVKSAYPELAAFLGSIPDDPFTTTTPYSGVIAGETAVSLAIFKVGSVYLMLLTTGRWYRSADALTWTAIVGSGGGGLLTPTYLTITSSGYPVATDGLGTWVFVNKEGNVYRSTDNLVSVGTGFRPVAATTTVISSIAYGSGRFVIVGYDSTSLAGFIYSSPDGLTWTLNTTAPFYPFGSRGMYLIRYANGIFFAVGTGSSSNGATVLTSVDGLTWTARNASKAVPGGVPYSLEYMANVNRWVISTATAGVSCYSSDNGVTLVKNDLSVGRNNPHGVLITDMRTMAYIHEGTAKPVLVSLYYDGSTSLITTYVRFSYDGIIWRQGAIQVFQSRTLNGMFLPVPHPTPGGGILINNYAHGTVRIDLCSYDRATEFVVPRKGDAGEWPTTDIVKTYIRK